MIPAYLFGDFHSTFLPSAPQVGGDMIEPVVCVYYTAINTLFLILSVYARFSVVTWFVIFVVLEWAPPQLLLFGVIDLAGAIWTYLGLKKNN